MLIEYFDDEVEELFFDEDIPEEPRRLDEIMAAHQELWDRIWYERSLMFEIRHRDAGEDEELEQMLNTAGPGRKRVEETYTRPGDLGPYTNFEWGMLNGKLSALNWVLGEEWDYLDT
ncbi:hypothetical protein [Promicromonospora sp. NPDC090134]|uniref:hypothetical protein n=1 Tax=Promicromonospora sp. NPDC090134 TaxID=3364408 RepID=UPI00382D31E5